MRDLEKSNHGLKENKDIDIKETTDIQDSQEISNDIKWKIFAATSICNFISAFSVNSMNLALPTFTELYNVSQSEVSWLALVYSLLPCCMLLFFGSTGDIFGYKRQFVAGFVIFGITSLLTPIFANGLGLLIIFRCLQAIGYSMITGICQAIVSRAFPAEERGKALGVNTVFVSIGLASGPTIGGILLTYMGWQWIFYFCTAFSIIGAIISSIVIPKDGPVKKGIKIDFPGAILFAAAAGLFAVALNFIDDFGFTTAIAAAFLVSILFLIAFIFREKRAVTPIMPMTLFQNRTFTIANSASVISYMVQQTINYLAPFYLVSYLLIPSDKSGIVMLAMPLAMMLSSPLGGSLADKKGFKYPAIMGQSLLCLTCIAMAFLPKENGSIMMLALLTMMGLSNGLSVAAINTGIFSGVPYSYLGVGSGMVATMRNLGQTLGVAYGSVMITMRNNAYIAKGIEMQDAYLKGQRDTFLIGAMLIIFSIMLLSYINKEKKTRYNIKGSHN